MTKVSDTSEPKSRLWIAATLSMSAILTTYLVSSFDQQKAQAHYEYSHSQRPVVVSSYLA